LGGLTTLSAKLFDNVDQGLSATEGQILTGPAGRMDVHDHPTGNARRQMVSRRGGAARESAKAGSALAKRPNDPVEMMAASSKRANVEGIEDPVGHR